MLGLDLSVLVGISSHLASSAPSLGYMKREKHLGNHHHNFPWVSEFSGLSIFFLLFRILLCLFSNKDKGILVVLGERHKEIYISSISLEVKILIRF